MIFRDAARIRQKAQQAKDPLAYERTILANERTFLAYVRTSLTFLGAGLGFLEFSRSGLSSLVGWIFIPIGIITLWFGFRSFCHSQQRIEDNALESKPSQERS